MNAYLGIDFFGMQFVLTKLSFLVCKHLFLDHIFYGKVCKLDVGKSCDRYLKFSFHCLKIVREELIEC
jgi:extradiol dioxygenase family protein